MFDTLIKQCKVGLVTKRFYQQYDCKVVYQIILASMFSLFGWQTFDTAYNHIKFVGDARSY